MYHGSPLLLSVLGPLTVRGYFLTCKVQTYYFYVSFFPVAADFMMIWFNVQNRWTTGPHLVQVKLLLFHRVFLAVGVAFMSAIVLLDVSGMPFLCVFS